MANIDHFKAELDRWRCTSKPFKCTITPAGLMRLADRNAAFLCTAANCLECTVGQYLSFCGDSIYMLVIEISQTWAVTFYNDTNFAIRNAMERWNNSLNHLVTGQGLTNHDDYTADLKVSQLDRDDRLLKTYTFINAFPLSVSAIELTAGGSADIETFEVTFRYQHFVTDGVSQSTSGR